MLKSKASWKGLDRKYLLSSDPYKLSTLFYDSKNLDATRSLIVTVTS